MPLTDDDFEVLGSLRGMRVFAETIRNIVNDSSRDNDSFEDKIKEALDAQVLSRDTKVIDKRLREAYLFGCPVSLERFEVTPDWGITQDRIDRLATCEWINHGQDLIIVGATGTGKSYLAKALGVAACRSKLTARYYRLNELADNFDTVAASPTGRKQLLEQLLEELTRPTLLIMDDFLATDVSTNALTQVFNLLVARENASTVIASQHEPDYWYDVFHDEAIADAVLSRLANNGTNLTITGQDMRERQDPQEERRTFIKKQRTKQSRKR